MSAKGGLGCSLAAVAVLGLAACGGSGGPIDVEGQAPAGISGALVCLDLDDGYTCDPGEPSATTDEQGRYSLRLDDADAKSHRLLWVAEGAAGNGSSHSYALVSVLGAPSEISVLSTILSVQTTVDEAGLKAALGITEGASLLGGYAAGGEISGFLAGLTPLYADVYAGVASDPTLDADQTIAGAVAILLGDAASVSDYVAQVLSENPLTPSNAASTSTTVGDEIFQAIPIDAATMSFGIGMNELTRKVVSGAYCLKGLQSELTPQLSVCQNTRSYLFRLVKSEKDLRDMLNVGGGLDLGTTVVTGSLEGRFVDEMRKDTSSIYALIKTEYVLCGYKTFDVSLDDAYLYGDATHASYTSNYEAFRSACGDRYLDTVTTGGAYYGLLKIQTSSLQEKKDLTVKLEGKYGKAGISVSVSGDLKSSVAEAVTGENVTIVVGSRGVSPEFLGLDNGQDQLIDNLDDFFNAADQFLDAISDPTNECHDDAVAYQKCAYTATFADYATVAHAELRNATQVKNLQFTKKLMGQYEDYVLLEKTIGEILAHAGDYDWHKHSIADVYYYLSYLRRGRLIMDEAFNKCLTDFTGCTNNPTASSLMTFNEIMMNLPFETWKAQQDCHDLQRLQGNQDVDNATVFLHGDITKPYTVSCRLMDTSEPEMYLALYNTSAAVSTPSYNYALSVDDTGAQTTSIYPRLRVHVNHDNLEVVYDQADQVTTDPATATAVRIGTAQDCNQTTGGVTGNIDLTGTIFAMDPAVEFQTTLAPQTRYQWVDTPMNWYDAKTYAEAQGGQLVEFDDTLEFATLHEDMLKNHPGKNAWIGMARYTTGAPYWQQFKWVYKNVNIVSREYEAYFHVGEPNNAGGGEACVHFWADAMLNDLACTTRLPFYIEFHDLAPTGGATFNADRTAVDISVGGAEAGKCAVTQPKGAIRLIEKI